MNYISFPFEFFFVLLFILPSSFLLSIHFQFVIFPNVVNVHSCYVSALCDNVFLPVLIILKSSCVSCSKFLLVISKVFTSKEFVIKFPVTCTCSAVLRILVITFSPLHTSDKIPNLLQLKLCTLPREQV